MSKRAWDPFTVGDTVGGALILEKLNDERLQCDLQYFVRWPCCDRTGVQTHSQLAKRHRTERSLCRSCTRKLEFRPEKRGPTKEEPEPSFAIEIPEPGISGRWTHLGKMGPRWGLRGADFKVERAG